MCKTIVGLTLACVSTMAISSANAGDHLVTWKHTGSQCLGVQFDNVDQWYAVPLNTAASPQFNTANLTQATDLLLAYYFKSMVNVNFPGDYVQCKEAFGNGGMVPRVTNID